MDLQDKILNAVLDIQSDVKDVKERISKIETSQESATQSLMDF